MRYLILLYLIKFSVDSRKLKIILPSNFKKGGDSIMKDIKKNNSDSKIFKRNQKKIIDYNDKNSNYCVSCGAEIPEGELLCKICLNKANDTS